MPIEEQATETQNTPDTNESAKDEQQESPIESDASASEPEAGNDETQSKESVAESEQQENRDDKGRRKNSFSNRIDELIKQREDALREAAFWREQHKSSAPDAPRQSDYADDEAFKMARLKYELKQELQSDAQKDSHTRAQKYDERAAQALDESYLARVAAVSESIPDFDEVVGKQTIPVSPELLQAVKESKEGPRIAYHLAKNPQLATELSSMDERQLLRRITKMEIDLAKPAVKTTSAPPPAKAGSGSRSSNAADLTKLSMEQYMAERKKQGARWAR